MLDYLADQLLSLLERVLQDAVAHKADRLLVTGTSSGFRFETDTGSSLAFLPRSLADWPEVRSIFQRLQTDAEQNGYPRCIAIHDEGEDITVIFKGNERYFQGRVPAIVTRLRG